MPNFFSLGFLLLPLLGGYIFLKLFHPGRYYFRHAEGHGLFFASASVGVVLLGVAQIISVELRDTSWGEPLGSVVKKYADFPHSGAALGALLLGLLSALLLDLLVSPSRAARWMARRTDDLLHLSIQAQREKEAVLFILRDRKCYVAYVLDTSRLRLEADYLRILPLHSGYQTQSELFLELPTFYDDTRELIKYHHGGQAVDPERLEDLKRLQIVIRRELIVSARLFNPSLYQKHYIQRKPRSKVVR